MFGKGRNHNSDINSKDIERMMQALDNIIAGDFDKVDVSEYDNQMYGNKLNKLIETFIITLLCVLIMRWSRLVIILTLKKHKTKYCHKQKLFHR